MKNTARKGNITEAKAILRLLELNYNIFKPVGDGSKCDFIIQNENGILLKVQCKTSRFEDGAELFNAYSSSRIRSVSGIKPKIIYTKNEIDLFCTFDLEDNMYLIPIEEVKVFAPRIKFFKKYIAE